MSHENQITHSSYHISSSGSYHSAKYMRIFLEGRGGLVS